jgi:streptomycin 6-kinase
MIGLNLPSPFVKNIHQTFGPAGERWLADLPALLDFAVQHWDLEPGAPVPNLSYNLVISARHRDGNDCILKLGVPDKELTSEIAALRLYDGQGACRLLESDAQKGLLLLERLSPGTMLCDHADDETQTAIAAQVMQRLWKPAPANEPLITLRGWFDGLDGLRPRFGGGSGPFPKHLVEATESLLPGLFADCTEPVVLHGDCHHFNILKSERGWLVIDPKGVIGPPEYEPAPLMLNPWSNLAKRPDARRLSERRIAILSERLGFDRQRLWAWAVCHSLLSAWWDLAEDGTGGEFSMACGEMFLEKQGNFAI